MLIWDKPSWIFCVKKALLWGVERRSSTLSPRCDSAQVIALFFKSQNELAACNFQSWGVFKSKQLFSKRARRKCSTSYALKGQETLLLSV